MFTFWGCGSTSEDNKTTQKGNEVSNSEIEPAKIDFTDILDKFPKQTIGQKLKFVGDYDVHVEPETHEELVSFLCNSLPSSELSDWILENEKFHTDLDWYCVRPVCRVERNDSTIFLLEAFERISGEGECYSDYWCVATSNLNTCHSIEKIGSTGITPFIESDEEGGTMYWIQTTDFENLEICFNELTDISCKQIRVSWVEGYDWRVDQNLNINDTVKLPIIERSYSLY